jgi:hypothetical protein
LFDIQQPLDPLEVGIFTEARWFSGAAAFGNVLGVASIYRGFYAVDVTDPANPVTVGRHALVNESEADVGAAGSVVVVTVEEAGLGASSAQTPRWFEPAPGLPSPRATASTSASRSRPSQDAKIC